MIKHLRKRHLQIWILWAVLLPVGIIVAWKAVPKKVEQELIKSEQSEVLSIVLDGDTRKGEYSVSLRTNGEGTKYQLSWQASRLSHFTNIYRRSTYLLYCVVNSERELIGRIGGYKAYYFNLPNVLSDTYDIIIYDPFKKKDIKSLVLKKSNK